MAPVTTSDPSGSSEHLVQFWVEDDSLQATIVDFLEPALAAGCGGLVIATEAHRQGISRLLESRGVSVESLLSARQLILLDARDTLARFMVDARPDRDLFARAIIPLIESVCGTGVLHVYGEMVDLLWRDGMQSAAFELEGLWNDLGKSRVFRLLCGYHAPAFDSHEHSGAFDRLCASHSDVVTEALSLPNSSVEGRRDVAGLQQRARALAREVATRRRAEESLQAALVEQARFAAALDERERDLADFFDNAPIPFHWIDGDGVIVRANQAELALLGYRSEEYVGRKIAEFHVDQSVIEDILARLRQGETIRDYPARLRHKNGSVRNVLLSSNVRWENGRFGHTRCFTRDVTESLAAEAMLLRASAIIESSDDAIISKDLDGRITSWNRGAERLYGYSADEMLGKSIALLIPPDHTNDFPMLMERLRRGERVEHYETVRVAKDGRRLEVSLTISPIRNATGQIIGASKIARDITERKHMEDALRASRAHLAEELAATNRLHAVVGRLLSVRSLPEALADVLENAMVTCGAPFGNVQLLNGAGDALEIVVQRGFATDFLEHFRQVRVDEGSACAQALRSGRRVVIENIELDPEYEPHREVALAAGYKAVQSTPLVAHSGRVLGMLSTHFDKPQGISDRVGQVLDLYARHAADVVERFTTERTLLEADQRKDEFIAILAHELRNPLAPVRNASHFLKLKELQAPDARRAVEMIDKQVGVMGRLIDDLLDISRISRGVLELRRERVVLSEVVDSAIESCRHEIEERQHTLRRSVPRQPVFLYADRVRLMQVLCNLLTNAAKYSPVGGDIQVSVSEGAGQVHFSVRDRGAGIPPEKLTEIFDLFARLDRALEQSSGGLGIGLTLARQIVELHGGSIEALSEGIGHGSEFVVHLPAIAAPLGDVDVAVPMPAKALRRIVVADDNRDAAETLGMILRVAGHDVHLAYDGEQALELAQTVEPDLMLLDIGMPKLDGYGVARRVRELPGGCDILLIALTGWGQEEDKRRAQEAGFSGHLVKPVAPEVLDQLVNGSL